VPGRCRLLIIGIDCADYYRVRQWVAEGWLPRLGQLAGQGQLVRCESTRPALTAPAWTTAITGCNPGKHGLFDFQDLRYPRRRAWWRMPRGCPTLFSHLSAAGLTCGALNVPMTYPAERINGVMVSGIGAPKLDENAFHPPSLRDELARTVPDYSLMPDMDMGAWPDRRTLADYADMRTRAAAELLRTQQPEVFMVVYGSLDWAVHGHSHEEGLQPTIRHIARAIDERVGDLIDLCGWPDTPVLIVSDHGMRRATTQVNLQKLFVELGLMAIGGGPEDETRAARRTRALVRAWNLAKRVLPAGPMHWVRRKAHRQRATLLDAAPELTVDWSRTLAAPVGAYGTVRLNVEGREPEGTVSRESYESVREDVMGRLRGATDPATGERLFAEVLSRDDVYKGPLSDAGADIILEPASDDLSFGGATTERDLFVFMNQPGLVVKLVPPVGVHSRNGVFLLSGKAARTGGGPDHCRLQDVTPTVLHLLGLAVPAYMDGRVLVESLSGEPARRPVQVVEEPLPPPHVPEVAATESDEELLTKRLEDLGYL
jgi:predicted AlkP superfamily phosphohydrolase/phosphomutase